MTLKKYRQVRLIATVLIAVIFSQSLVMKNFIFPLITLIVAWVFLNYLRLQVKEVIADERDYQVGGQSAFSAIQIYSWVAVIIMFVLYASRDLNPTYEAVALTLAYSTCFLMLVYSLIFKFHDKITLSKNKLIYSFIISVIIAFLAIFTLRFFSGEDNWICQKGEWVKHGQPSFPAPSLPCK